MPNHCSRISGIAQTTPPSNGGGVRPAVQSTPTPSRRADRDQRQQRRTASGAERPTRQPAAASSTTAVMMRCLQHRSCASACRRSHLRARCVPKRRSRLCVRTRAPRRAPRRRTRATGMSVKYELGVGQLPQQEVADALLAAGADEQVGLGRVGQRQVAASARPRRARSGVHARRPCAAACRPARCPSGRRS